MEEIELLNIDNGDEFKRIIHLFILYYLQL